MRSTYLTVAASICAFFTSGCAYLTNYTKSIDLSKESYAIDVKQRVVFSQKRPSDNPDGKPTQIVVCAEPSPDALTVISASGGLSMNNPQTGTIANAGAALSENGAFVGLRTHSIQLLRDAMYRLCEGYAAGAVSAQNFQGMQRRYQSTMMGLIAIEQLTGPVVAGQALLTTSAAAQAGAGAGDTAVTAAQSRVDVTSATMRTAQKNLDAEDAEVSAAKKKEDEARFSLQQEQAKKPADTSADSIAQKKSELESKADDRRAALREQVAAKREVEDAKKANGKAEHDLNIARSRVSATASGSGALGEVSRSMADSTESLALAVVDIVKEINYSYLRDSCFSFTSELLRDTVHLKELQSMKFDVDGKNRIVDPTPMVKGMIETCQTILENEAARLLKATSAVEAKRAASKQNAPAK